MDGISKGAWLNRSSIIFAGDDKWSVDPRVSIVSSVGDKHEYSLQIQKVDVTDDGQYTCSIQSERNPRPKLLNLIVKGTLGKPLFLCCCVSSESRHFFFSSTVLKFSCLHVCYLCVCGCGACVCVLKHVLLFIIPTLCPVSILTPYLLHRRAAAEESKNKVTWCL